MQYKAIILSVYWFGATVATRGLSLEAAFLSASAIWLILALGDMVLKEFEEGTDTDNSKRDPLSND